MKYFDRCDIFTLLRLESLQKYPQRRLRKATSSEQLRGQPSHEYHLFLLIRFWPTHNNYLTRAETDVVVGDSGKQIGRPTHLSPKII